MITDEQLISRLEEAMVSRAVYVPEISGSNNKSAVLGLKLCERSERRISDSLANGIKLIVCVTYRKRKIVFSVVYSVVRRVLII